MSENEDVEYAEYMERITQEDLLRALVETSKTVSDTFHKMHEDYHRLIHDYNEPTVEHGLNPELEKCVVCGYE